MADRQPVHSAPCHLQRIVAPDNVWRFYTPTLTPDLFGGVTLVREWGRIGQDGTVRRRHFTDEAAAERELDRIARRKIRRRYRLLAPPPGPANKRAAPPPFDPPAYRHARNARQAASTPAAGARPRPRARVAVHPPQTSAFRQTPPLACRA